MKQLTLEEAHAVVGKLAEDFDANKAHFLSASYQEQEVRTDFINKFLVALGWDVNHEWQKNPFAQEVKVERGVSMLGSQRRADYAFYIAPNFKDVRFFIEAKKPFGDITNAENYFQTIRYGWNAQTSIAVLTDFEEFHVLDCRYKPNIDNALTQGLLKYHYSDYSDLKKFSEIYYLFSRDAVAAGSLDSFSEQLPKKRGKAVQRGLFSSSYLSIDDAFLEELDAHRETLARTFKNRNPELDGELLTEITQRTIDRLVFIRFLEDKLIHPENLVANFGDRSTAWNDFISSCSKLDGIYNGIVFKRHTVLDDPNFKVDDDVFSDICESLADINTAYDFNVIPIHILGSIYERFLGKIIVTTDKRARVVDKPEVRDAGGVFYTPQHIVRYIVDETVGKLIQGKSPGQIAEMRFADISCGSGSFLLGILDLLFRYHLNWYNANPDKAKKAGCVFRDDGAWHLSLKQRREILLNNIFGVDIDRQAVEVAQLSLYLKLLEEETTATARHHQLEFHETLLPTLSQNIVCGNSVIGTDILTGQLFEPVEERKLNPMDFPQRFPKIMAAGGFDATIGNPPWISLKGKFGNDILPPCGIDYLTLKYDGDTYRPNMYEYFVRQAITLTKKDGYCSYIVPDRLGLNLQFEKTRAEILKTCTIESLIYKAKFPKIIADTLIFVFRKTPASGTHIVLVEEYEKSKVSIPQREYAKMTDKRFAYPKDIANMPLFAKIDSKKHLRRLDYFLNSSVGFIGSAKKVSREKTPNAQKVLKGENVLRYGLSGNFWFEWKKSNLAGGTQDTEKLGTHPKILLRKTGAPLFAALDEEGIFPEQSLYFLYPREGNACSCKFYLGIINSHFFDFYYRNRLVTNADSTPQLKKVDLDSFPLPVVELSNVKEKALHDQMVSLVDSMLTAKKALALAKSDADKDYYSVKRDTLDGQISRLINILYDLDDAEKQAISAISP